MWPANTVPYTWVIFRACERSGHWFAAPQPESLHRQKWTLVRTTVGNAEVDMLRKLEAEPEFHP
jgi:hypothetical protein